MAVSKAAAIAFARKAIGIPYVWGGTTAAGYDCSGLVYAAYRAAGFHNIGRTTWDQMKQGVRVSLPHIQPGDIVFTEHGAHEGLYIGNGIIISAPHTGAKVHRIPLSQFGSIYQIRRLPGNPAIATGHPGKQAARFIHETQRLASTITPIASIQVPTLQPMQAPSLPLGNTQASPLRAPTLPTPKLASVDTHSLDAIRQRLLT